MEVGLSYSHLRILNGNALNDRLGELSKPITCSKGST